MPFSARYLLFCLLFATNLLLAGGKMTIAYHLSWAQPHFHYVDVKMTVENPAAKNTTFRMPAWRPGRYAIQNFMKNVIEFQATDGKGNALNWQKTDKDSWQVKNGNAKQIVVSYRYFANELDAGNSFLDDSEAYFNPINFLMYIPGKEALPLTLTFDNPENWRVVTALESDSKSGALLAADYHELADSPILLSPDVQVFSFQYDNAVIEIALQGEGNYQSAHLIEDFTKMIKAQHAIFGGALPFQRYVFLIHLVNGRIGHGVEHKNSTSMVLGPADFENNAFYYRFISLASHEFFHVWNVERIRPAALDPPDYSRENYTHDMWFYEGVTSYYENLTLFRAGLITEYGFYNELERVMGGFLRSPGARRFSPAMESWNEWGKFRNSPPPGTSESFYRSGHVLGILLDLDIRGRTGNAKSLDDVMRYLYQNYAKKNRGVPEGDIQKAIEHVAGNSFQAFFDDYVHGTKIPDYKAFFAYAGLEVEAYLKKDEPAAFLGIVPDGREADTRIRNIYPNSPAMVAGLVIDDLLIAIDNRRATAKNYKKLLKKYQPGESITVSVFRRDKLRHFKAVLTENPLKELRIIELENSTPAQVALRKNWLGK